MQPVNIGIIGLGNVGTGTLDILAENAAIRSRSSWASRCDVRAVCSRGVADEDAPAGVRLGAQDHATGAKWWTIPDVQIVAELVGGTGVAREIIEAAIAARKVRGHREQGVDGAAPAPSCGIAPSPRASISRWKPASPAAFPFTPCLREGISGDRIDTLYGILNGTCNYILTEIEQRGAAFDQVLAEAQQAGYAEADPSADVDGFDARSKLAILSALAFGERIVPADIYTEGIRRITPVDFEYAHQLHHTIRLVCAARQTPAGLILSVRPSLIPQSTILASVRGAYNAVWVRGQIRSRHVLLRSRRRLASDRSRGGQRPDARGPRDPLRKSGARFAVRPRATRRVSARSRSRCTDRRIILRFRVQDRPGIIAQLAAALAAENISIDAVLQLPNANWRDLPFVITVEPTTEHSVRAAIARMAELNFFIEPPLAMPMEKSL